MGMSKMVTGNIKIFISRLNDFEIAQSEDEILMREGKREGTSLPLAPVSPLFASTRSSPSEHRAPRTVHCYSD